MEFIHDDDQKINIPFSNLISIPLIFDPPLLEGLGEAL